MEHATQDEINERIQQLRAGAAFGGFNLPFEVENLVRKKMAGEITHEEAVFAIKKARGLA